MEIKEKIAISTVGVSVSTLLSRILGYIRDMLTADLLGAGMAADALFVAYRIPNLFRRLLGEGALSASFIPVFTEYLGVKGEKEAKELFNMILIILSLVLMTLTVCGIIFTPFIVRLIAPGFAGSSGKMELTVMLTRILLPFMVAIGTGALALGVLNSLHLFMIPALAPCMLSISEIFFLLFICPGMGKPVFGLAFGILIGGFAQMSFQIPPIARRGYFEGFFSGIHEKISSAFKHPGVRNIGLLMLPATIGLSVSQINTFVDAICASFLKEGSVTALYYAGRLTQFPQALFGTAVATVSLPLMSSSSLSSGFDKMRDVLGTGIRMVLLTILPASVGLMILARPIVALLFERGQFTVAATAMTSWALLFYATGLIGYAGVSLMTASFYSLKDTKTPVKIAAFCMVLNIVLNLILMGPLQVGGLALASAVASFANLSLLMLFLKKRIGGLGIKNILPSFLKMLLASSLLAAFCAGSHGFFKGGSRLVHMGITIPLGILVYVLTLYLLKCEEITKITKRGRFLS